MLTILAILATGIATGVLIQAWRTARATGTSTAAQILRPEGAGGTGPFRPN